MNPNSYIFIVVRKFYNDRHGDKYMIPSSVITTEVKQLLDYADSIGLSTNEDDHSDDDADFNEINSYFFRVGNSELNPSRNHNRAWKKYQVKDLESGYHIIGFYDWSFRY